MTNETAAQLLAVASAFDNRIVEMTKVQAWATALAGLNPDDCVEAIKAHYRESPEYLMPAHIVSRVRQMMTDRRNRETTQALAIEAPLAGPESYGLQDVRRELQGITTEIPKEDWPHPVIDDMSLPKRHACPACKAEVGIGCENRGNKQPLWGFHYSRLVRAGLADPEKPFDAEAFAEIVARYPAPDLNAAS
jgi:hypothetical protein